MRTLIESDLTYCNVDGHLIFLDIAQDRYFRLTSRLEAALQCFLAREKVPAEQLAALISEGILLDDKAPHLRAQIPDILSPTRSAIESQSKSREHAPSLIAMVEVASIVWSVQRRLRRSTFKAVIEDAIAYRSSHISPHATVTVRAIDKLLAAAAQFERARRYVPTQPICLLDSLSLLRFLSRRRLPAKIVLGVTREPFAAHCWVQAGDIVLNETLSDANAHTPIRTI